MLLPQMVRVSLRTVTMQIPSQKIIRKDNVSIDIAAEAERERRAKIGAAEAGVPQFGIAPTAIYRRFRVSNFIQISIGDARRFVTIEPLPQGDRAFNPTPFRGPAEGGSVFPPTTKGLRP